MVYQGCVFNGFVTLQLTQSKAYLFTSFAWTLGKTKLTNPINKELIPHWCHILASLDFPLGEAPLKA